jgi:tRNA dimethylallyltransferase
MKYTKNNLITILGPTACGKTAFAAQLAYQIDGEIISGDSRQVYKRMDLGTGKDISEYTVNGCSIPYHLIDIAEPGYRYNIFEYQDDFSEAFKQIQSKQKYPILCGGSGMYIESVLRDYQLLNTKPKN